MWHKRIKNQKHILLNCKILGFGLSNTSHHPILFYVLHSVYDYVIGLMLKKQKVKIVTNSFLGT